MYEKMFINKKLDEMEKLVKLKQKEIDRVEQYDKKKNFLKLKKRELEDR